MSSCFENSRRHKFQEFWRNRGWTESYSIHEQVDDPWDIIKNVRPSLERNFDGAKISLAENIKL